MSALDPNSVVSNRAQIYIELASQCVSWTAGTQLSGVVRLNVLFPQDGMPAFPSSALTIQLIGMEESHFGDVKAGRKEIIQLVFPIAQWTPESYGPSPGQYSIPFTLSLPDWLPDSMMLAEPVGNILLQVKYRLTA